MFIYICVLYLIIHLFPLSIHFRCVFPSPLLTNQTYIDSIYFDVSEDQYLSSLTCLSRVSLICYMLLSVFIFYSSHILTVSVTFIFHNFTFISHLLICKIHLPMARTNNFYLYLYSISYTSFLLLPVYSTSLPLLFQPSKNLSAHEKNKHESKKFKTVMRKTGIQCSLKSFRNPLLSLYANGD